MGSRDPVSVSPLNVFDVEGEADDEHRRGDPMGIDCERLALAKEGGSVKTILDPLLPSEADVEEHWVRGHLPFRNWCEICVRSRGREMDHTRMKEKERMIPECTFDYCFPGDEMGFKWTVLVGKERKSKSFFATAVPNKGARGRFASDKCIEFMRENGNAEGQVIVKTDQEPSIKFLVNDVVQGRPEGRTIPEESLVKSSGSNGIVERSVGEVECQMRSLLLGFQTRIGRRIYARERIISFPPEYAAYLLNILHQGDDGKVPYERMKRKKLTVLAIEFGEMVMYNLKTSPKKAELNTRWENGLFVGIKRFSNEVLVSTRDGIEEVRSIKRVPIERRLGEDNINMVKWAPWRRYKDAVEADGDLPEGVPVEEQKIDNGGSRTAFVETKGRIPREFLHIP
jgi:hypothetical protein